MNFYDKNIALNECNFNFSLKLIKDHCMSFIVKDDNYNNIVMTNDFEALDKPLMVEIVRKRVYPGRMNDIRISKLLGILRFTKFSKTSS